MFRSSKVERQAGPELRESLAAFRCSSREKVPGQGGSMMADNTGVRRIGSHFPYAKFSVDTIALFHNKADESCVISELYNSEFASRFARGTVAWIISPYYTFTVISSCHFHCPFFFIAHFYLRLSLCLSNDKSKFTKACPNLRARGCLLAYLKTCTFQLNCVSGTVCLKQI